MYKLINIKNKSKNWEVFSNDKSDKGYKGNNIGCTYNNSYSSLDFGGSDNKFSVSEIME